MSSPDHGREAALHEIVTALQTPPQGDEAACALCRRVAQSVERGMRSFFAEFVNDPRVRENWRQARGFCSEHTALAIRLGDSLAVAILYSDLARLTCEQCHAAGHRDRRGILPARMRRSLPLPSASCPACLLAQEAAARYAGALAAGLEAGSSGLWEAFEADKGLCLTHAEQVIVVAAPTVAARLRQRLVARLTEMQAELEEIIRKNDYRFRGEPWGPEKDAWLRALQVLKRPPRPG